MIVDIILTMQEKNKMHALDSDLLELYEEALCFDYTDLADKIMYGNNNTIRKALCHYIYANDYNPDICEYIKKVVWT